MVIFELVFAGIGLVSSRRMLILMRSKEQILVGGLAWRISKSSSGFRIDEPK